MRGLIGFSGRRGIFLSRAIKWFTKSKWSHTFIVLDDELILEAGRYQVQITLYEKYMRDRYTITGFKPFITKETIETSLNNVIKRVGTSYGWLQIIGIAFVRGLKKIGIGIRNPFRGGIICTELVHDYLERLGFDMPFADKDAISPEDLFNYLKVSDKFEQVELK